MQQPGPSRWGRGAGRARTALTGPAGHGLFAATGASGVSCRPDFQYIRTVRRANRLRAHTVIYPFPPEVLRANNVETFDKYWIGVGDVHDDATNIGRIPGVAGAAGVIVSGDITTHGGVAGARRALDVVRAANPAVMAQIGNMDGEPVQDWLEAEGMNIHTRTVELAPGVGLMGVGWSSPTPFGTPSEVPDERIGQWLDATYEDARAKGLEQLLLVVHTPPQGSGADDLGGGRHVGSPAVRAFIERVSPAACLTGHIHEGRSASVVAGTPVVNPGMLAMGGYAFIGLKDGELSIALRIL